MIRFSQSSSDAGSPNIHKEQPPRYRGSCDRCQDIKVRCSRDKPVCERCARKAVSCIYSHMRRMGRPRIGSQITSHENNINGNNMVSGVLSESFTPVSSSTDIHREQSDGHLTDGTSVTPATRTIITPQSLADSSLGEQGSRGDGTQPGHVLSVGNQCSPQLRTNSWEVSHHLPAVVHARSPMQPNFPERHIMSQEVNPRTTFQTNAYNTNGPITTDSATDCYITILRRTTKLEESLLMTTPAPSVDLVLETEQDFRGLQQRCFACTGHGKVGRSCLQSDRPVFLSLTLLAERVITMLEETFRLAVHRTSTTYEGVQDLLENPLPVTASRRIDRSFRSLLNLPCVFPIPAGNMDVRVGNHVVDGHVKARAVKKILQLRTQKLLLALREMRAVPQLHRRGKFMSGPLDWGGSSAVLDDAAGILIKDLIRRMEALQGGLTLMG